MPPLDDGSGSARMDANERSASPALKRPAAEMGNDEVKNEEEDTKMDVDGEKIKPNRPSSRHRREQSVDMIGNSNAEEPSSGSGSENVYPTPSSMSTYATSASEESRARSDSFSHSTHDAPSIDEQVATVMGMMGETPTEKAKGYVVSSNWLKRVLARSSNAPVRDAVDKTAGEGEVGPVDNSDLVLVTDPATSTFKDEKGHPFVPLRPGLQMSDDYEIIPAKAWDMILKWYGLSKDSPAIVRYAHNTNIEGGLENYQYEMNPPIFTILKLPTVMATPTQELRDKSRPPAKILASTHTPVQKWLKDVKELASIEMSTKVRVWRVLEGLSGSSSGTLTPAASRSQSPAPGSIVTANAGNSLVLDTTTFIGLSEGSQRELLEIKDQTTTGKYNGKSFTLHMAGMGGDSVIVIEEQVGGEWVSESKGTVSKATAKSLKSKIKTKSAQSSGRSTPVPTAVRGRRRKDGKARGVTGLSNLGNTCYMNSALQCVKSVEELTVYFLENEYKKELNPSNPLGHNGDVAKAYGNLLNQLFDENGMSSFAPRSFKSTIGRYGPSFSGYGQQDSQEFLLFLLDGLQEDLNRIFKKPYIEKPDSTDEMVVNRAELEEFADRNWDIYKARNDSVITDLFAGMYKSTLHCPACDKVSIIFDPFNNLTLQLPIESTWNKQIYYFGLDKSPVLVDVEIDKNASIKSLKEYVAKKVNSDPRRLVMAEIYNHKFYKVFENTTCISEANIKSNEDIAIYELESVPTSYNPDRVKKASSYSFMFGNSFGSSDEDPVSFDSPGAERMIIPIYHRLVKPQLKFGARKFFGAPMFIVVKREEAFDYDIVLQKVLACVGTMTTRDILHEDDDGDEVMNSDVVVTDEDAKMEDPQVTDESVEGEDGLVDVSMRDAGDSREQENQSLAAGRDLPKALRRGNFIPPGLRHLFDVKFTKTNSATGTGNNVVDEKEMQLMENRVVANNGKGKQKKPTSMLYANNTPASSEDDLNGPALGNTKSEEDSSSAETKTESVSESDSDGIPPNPNRVVPKWKKSSRKTKGKRAPVKLPYIRPGEAVVLDWKEDTHDALFGATKFRDEIRGSPTWEGVQRLPDPDLDKKRQLRNHKKRHGVTLDECLDEYGREEILSENDAWYCPRCKEHRRASKKFELWKTPDILVMHIKRFSANRGFRDKLDVHVDFPIELDMTGRVMMPEEGKSLEYDLIAVDNHYGGLGGGHYTAYAKNFVDGAWYEYNDSHVSRKLEPESVVTKAAYLLFYRRRSNRPLGGAALAGLTESAFKDESADSEESDSDNSPSRGKSGEGKRLGDSSRNGSSSASTAVAAAHQPGDGGLQGAVRRKAKAKDKQKQAEDEDDDGLPGYSDNLPSGETRVQYGSMDLDEDVDEGYDESNYTYNTHQPFSYGSGEPAWSFGNLETLEHEGHEPYAYDDNDPQTTSASASAQMSHGPSLFDETDFSAFRRNRDDDDDSMKAMRSSDDGGDGDNDSDMLSMNINPIGADSDIDADDKVDDIFIADGEEDDGDEVMLEGRGRGRSREREGQTDLDSFRINQEEPAEPSVRKSIERGESSDDDDEDELPVVELTAPTERK